MTSRRPVIAAFVVALACAALASVATSATAQPATATATPLPTTATPQPTPAPSPSPPATEPPSPQPSITPSPPVPPPDASAISATTPPLRTVSPNPVPTLPDALWLASNDTSVVHVDIHGGRPFVPVVVDGVRREFLLSTLEHTAIDDSIYVAAKPGSESLQTLQIGDVRLTSVHVGRARIAPFTSTYIGYQADGIIGSELFARYPVTIDYPAGALTIYRTEDAAAKARPVGAAVLPLEIVGGAPAVTCAVDNTNASPCMIDVDSDADLMLDWNTALAQRMLRLGPSLSCMREAEPGREMFGRIARANELVLGSVSVSQPLVRLPSPAVNPSPDPLTWRTSIGSGVLGRFAATIDESGGVLVLSSDGGGAPAVPPAFDRSGLWLIWRSGGVVVRNVIEDSPAAAAGILAGDAIVAVDGKPALDLDAVRAILSGDPGSQVAVTYQRGLHQGHATFALRNLL